MRKFATARTNKVSGIWAEMTAPSKVYPSSVVVENWLGELMGEFGGDNPQMLAALAANYYEAFEKMMAEETWRPKLRYVNGKRYISGVPVWRAVFFNAANDFEMSAALWFGHQPERVDLDLVFDQFPEHIDVGAKVRQFNMWFEA